MCPDPAWLVLRANTIAAYCVQSTGSRIVGHTDFDMVRSGLSRPGEHNTVTGLSIPRRIPRLVSQGIASSFGDTRKPRPNTWLHAGKRNTKRDVEPREEVSAPRLRPCPIDNRAVLLCPIVPGPI